MPIPMMAGNIDEEQKQMIPAEAPVPAAPEVPAEDPRLQAAIDQQNKLEMYSNLLKGFQQIASSKAIGYGYKPDYSGSEFLSQAAKRPVEQYKTQLGREDLLKKQKMDAEKAGMEKETHQSQMKVMANQIAKSDIDLTNQKDADNPDSRMSIAARETSLQLLEMKLGRKPTPEEAKKYDGASATVLYKNVPELQFVAQEAAKQRSADLDRASREKISAEDNAAKSADRKQVAADKLEAQKEKRAEVGSEGQKAVDKDYAKHYNEFTSTGVTNATTAIEKLDSLASEMEKDQGFGEAGGGRIASVLPDAVRSRDAIRRRDAARNLANRTLKALFGAQLSDAEREAAAKEYYNDALGNKENAEILRAKIKDLQIGLQQEQTKAKYYETNGSLKGFTGTQVQANNDFVMMQAPDGSPPVKVKKDQAQKYLDKGAKIVQ